MRRVLALAVACLGAVSTATAASQPRVLAASRVSVTIPGGWYGAVSKTTSCDPERLLAVSSAPLQLRMGQRLAAPERGQVLLVVLEDRYVQDRPLGDLQRPMRFTVTWDRLVHVKAICGLPDSAAYMRYFKTHGRYLGFIVYPGSEVGATTRKNTLTVMNSLHVSR